MKTKNIYQCLALLAMALTTTACQNELNEDTTQPQPGEKVSMTIRATQRMAPQTRTSYEDKLGVAGIDGIVVKWEGGTAADAPVESMKVFGYEAGEQVFSNPEIFTSDPSTLDKTNGLSISFTGTRPTGTKLLAVYPADNCTIAADGSLDFDFSKQTQKDNKDMAHLKKCDITLGTEVPGSTNNNFKFEHKAIMLCFDLNLPTEEKVKLVTLENSIVDGIMNKAFFLMDTNDLQGYNEGDEKISVSISNPSLAKDWKVYMMIPDIDISSEDATLTITVTTETGKNFVGKLYTDADTTLDPGMCYTLKPTLMLDSKASADVTGKNLSEVLDNITLDPSQNEFALTGNIADGSLSALKTLLQKEESKNIVTLDLSGLTGVTEVTGLDHCANVQTITLPTDAVTIGEGAFENCTSLKTLVQNEPEQPEIVTRASISSKLTTIKKNAFKGCSSMTEMFLHGKLSNIGENAFANCDALKYLVFEGTYEVGAGIKLGINILSGSTPEDLIILLPKIDDVAKAAGYKTALERTTYYQYIGPGGYEAEDEEKVKSENYKASVPDGSNVGTLEPGGSLGQ